MKDDPQTTSKAPPNAIMYISYHTIKLKVRSSFPPPLVVEVCEQAQTGNSLEKSYYRLAPVAKFAEELYLIVALANMEPVEQVVAVEYSVADSLSVVEMDFVEYLCDKAVATALEDIVGYSAPTDGVLAVPTGSDLASYYYSKS